MESLIDASIIPEIINVALLALLIVTAVAVIYVRNLLTAAMLLGIYSLVMAGCWTILDAVDVAFTEAAVGAGITTVLFLATIALVGREERGRAHGPLVPLIVTIGTGAALIYATVDMPNFGVADAPVHQHVAPRYIERSETEAGVPNIVTAVLASYRGFDTLGETTVVFTAASAVILLLAGGGGARRRKNKTESDKEGEA